MKRPLVLIGADGKPFAQRGDCVAAPVTVAELPTHLKDALVAMEDRRFFGHLGIDPIGIARAVSRNYEAGFTREGGSTITQQLVKMSYLSSAKTLERKFEEAWLALWLELRLSKDEILERYLNSAYFGEGCFGVRAAARHFFDKPVDELSVGESALLVALLRSPTQLTNNFADAFQRARLVMQSMHRDGRLSETELANAQPPALNPARAEETGSYYADWLTEGLQAQMQDPHARVPVLVHTSFEPGLQTAAMDAVRTVLDKRGERQKASQAALVAMRTDGRVVAMVGGRERAASQFNRAVQARRQPGSAFKTFVYLAALRAGVSPDIWITDEPIAIDGWEPKNIDEDFNGSMSLTKAFAGSVNTVAVKLSEAVGRETVIQTARELGIASPMAPNASIALGTSEVSLLELTSAYASIAAGAYPVKPWAVVSLDAAPADDGVPPHGAGEWELEEAGEMRHLLMSVVRGGSGTGARLPIPAFGKTGTSQGYRDAWFVGFAGNLVVGVWVGNDDFTPMRRVTGGSLPAEIWRRFMREAIKSDEKFERKLQEVEAFEARTPERLERELISSLDDLASPGASSSYGHVTVRGNFARPRAAPRPMETYRPRGRVSGEFQRRLGDMGWPGQ